MVTQIVFGALALLGLALMLLWLIGSPLGEDDEEELAGFVTANWDEIEEPDRQALRLLIKPPGTRSGLAEV